MKKGIHPSYHDINVKLTNNTIITTKSTYGKEGDTLTLDIDYLSHPAWTGVQKLMDNSGSLAKFNKKFSSFGLKKN
ncbi:50S ribosomal protein L31 [Rickettsiales bacterium LUAb2]